ncbi:hypothetical protein OIU92_11440 [Escherichia coli]|nr:hypothetical protein [Escherichia coli]
MEAHYRESAQEDKRKMHFYFNRSSLIITPVFAAFYRLRQVCQAI